MKQEQVDQALDNMASSIMDSMDNTSPLESSVMRPPKEEEQEEPAKEVAEEPEKEPEKEPEVEPEKPSEKKKIKWQGQDVEIEPDKEVEYLQKGYDYTQKTQELSRLKQEIAPLEGLAKQIQSDPNLAKHIAGYFKQKDEPKQFEDPIDELEDRIIQKVRKEVVAPIQEQQNMMSHKQVLDATRAQVQADPLYKDVQQKMSEYVQSLPPQLQKITYLQLDQDPNAYLEFYGQLRKQIETKPAKADLPKPIKKEEKAPILESAGKASEALGDPKKTEKIAKLKAKALREGEPGALADWLLQSGNINHLF